MKEIIIKFEPFVFKQLVFIKDNETGNIQQEYIPQKELASYLSLKQDICKIHLFGNAKFAEKIKKECATKYSINTDIIINK